MLSTIKSYVLRGGRLSNRQQKGLEKLPAFSLKGAGPLDLAYLFNREADTLVEIGFGMGASLFAQAQRQPELNFIGIEVHKAGVGSLVADLSDKGLSNVRIAMDDAVDVFKTQIPANSLQGIQIFFPDPWHKKRHHKRRLIQPAFVNLLVEKLKPEGFLHCATDWEDYALHILSLLSATDSLVNKESMAGFSPRPDSKPLTKFEQRGKNLGHGVWDLIFFKK